MWRLKLCSFDSFLKSNGHTGPIRKVLAFLAGIVIERAGTVGVTASSVNLHKVVKLELSTISFDVRSLWWGSSLFFCATELKCDRNFNSIFFKLQLFSLAKKQNEKLSCFAKKKYDSLSILSLDIFNVWSIDDNIQDNWCLKKLLQKSSQFR